MKINIKEELYRQCISSIETRIGIINNAISEARQAQQNETKSSAGDKYETLREMMTQEIGKYSQQLNEATQQKNALQHLQLVDAVEQVVPGSVVFTETVNFYVSVSLGQVEIDGSKFICLSPLSPLGIMFLGKQVGDKIAFNKQQYTIMKIM